MHDQHQISGHETILATDIKTRGNRGVIHEQLEKIGRIRRADIHANTLFNADARPVKPDQPVTNSQFVQWTMNEMRTQVHIAIKVKITDPVETGAGVRSARRAGA